MLIINYYHWKMKIIIRYTLGIIVCFFACTKQPTNIVTNISTPIQNVQYGCGYYLSDDMFARFPNTGAIIKDGIGLIVNGVDITKANKWTVSGGGRGYYFNDTIGKKYFFKIYRSGEYLGATFYYSKYMRKLHSIPCFYDSINNLSIGFDTIVISNPCQ